MTKEFKIAIFWLLCFLPSLSWAQKEYYDISKLPFNKSTCNEFSPVEYQNGLIFCSDKKSDIFLSYKGTENSYPLELYTVEYDDSSGWKNVKNFDRTFSSLANDGPLTIAKNGRLIILSQNLKKGLKLKDVDDPNNKLGLFISTFDGSKWSELQPFPFNNPAYSITTPALDSTGSLLIFASDMPGGMGGSDLYKSEFKDGMWQLPVNLGKSINSDGNESYPFLTNQGELLFASDGRGGMGGKDIFRCIKLESGWGEPKGLKPPINSQYDDFGIFADDYLDKGYFTSNRDKSDDIYAFESRFQDFTNCANLSRNQNCFEFFDDNDPESTGLKLRYVWEFSDGSVMEGLRVKNCFENPGHYNVVLKIYDKNTDTLFLSQNRFSFDVLQKEQPYINMPAYLIQGRETTMDGLKTWLPGTDIKSYYWEFGDDFLAMGSRVKHQYQVPGIYTVQLGVVGTDSLGNRTKHCVKKEIDVLTDFQQLSIRMVKENEQQIKALTAPLADVSLRKSPFLRLKESFILTYISTSLQPGKRNEIVNELSRFNFKKLIFPETGGLIDTTSYMDAVFRILNENPALKVWVTSHTDNTLTPGASNQLSLYRSNLLLHELIKRGLPNERIYSKNFGFDRPLAELFPGIEPVFDNRIEFFIFE